MLVAVTTARPGNAMRTQTIFDGEPNEAERVYRTSRQSDCSGRLTTKGNNPFEVLPTEQEVLHRK